MATNNESRINDVDRMTDKMLKLSDDYDRKRVSPEAIKMKTRIATTVFSGISLRRKLINDLRQAEIDVTPNGRKKLPAKKE